MKRRELLRHLHERGCALERTAVPRHTEIDNFLARKICRDFDIQEP